MVWILITTFMVVVGSGQCSEAAAATFDHGGASECQLQKAVSQQSKIHSDHGNSDHGNSDHISPSAQPRSLIVDPVALLGSVLSSRWNNSDHALGTSILADMRFSGTSPPLV